MSSFHDLNFPHDWNVDWEDWFQTHRGSGVNLLSVDLMKSFIDATNERINAINFYTGETSTKLLEDTFGLSLQCPYYGVKLLNVVDGPFTEIGYPKEGYYALSCSLTTNDYDTVYNPNRNSTLPLNSGADVGVRGGIPRYQDLTIPNPSSLFLNPYAYKEHFISTGPYAGEFLNFTFKSNRQGTWDVSRFNYMALLDWIRYDVPDGNMNTYMVNLGFSSIYGIAPCFDMTQNLSNSVISPGRLGNGVDYAYVTNFREKGKFSLDCVMRAPIFYQNVLDKNYYGAGGGYDLFPQSGYYYSPWTVASGENAGVSWPILQAKVVSLAKFFLKKHGNMPDGSKDVVIDYSNMAVTIKNVAPYNHPIYNDGFMDYNKIFSRWEQNGPHASGFSSYTPSLYLASPFTSEIGESALFEPNVLGDDVFISSEPLSVYNTMIYNGMPNFFRQPIFIGEQGLHYTADYIESSYSGLLAGDLDFINDHGTVIRPPSGSFIPSGMYNFLPVIHRLRENFPSITTGFGGLGLADSPGFRRKFPREIWSSKCSGVNGQIARLIKVNANISGVISSGWQYEAYPNWVQNPNDPYYLKNVQTPDFDFKNCGKIHVYSSSLSGWIPSTQQSLTPDTLTANGLIQPGDYFGPWILNDLKDAINQLTWTWGFVNDGTLVFGDVANSPVFGEFSQAPFDNDVAANPYRANSYPTFKLIGSATNADGIQENNINRPDYDPHAGYVDPGGNTHEINQTCSGLYLAPYVFDIYNAHYLDYANCVFQNYPRTSGNILPLAYAISTNAGSETPSGVFPSGSTVISGIYTQYQFGKAYCYIRPSGFNPDAFSSNGGLDIDIYSVTEAYQHATVGLSIAIDCYYDLYGDQGGTQTPAHEEAGPIDPDVNRIPQYRLVSSNKIGTITVATSTPDGGVDVSDCLLIGDKDFTTIPTGYGGNTVGGYRTKIVYGVAKWDKVFNYTGGSQYD